MESRLGQWSLDELDEEARERGLSSPFELRAAVQLAVARMIAAGEAEWIRPGVVRYSGRTREARTLLR